MVPKNGIISAVVIAFVISVIQAESNVPVYIWNIDTDAELSALPTLSSQQLISKLSLSLDRKLIAIFLQDELSTEDFISDDLNEVREVAEKSDDGTVYAPSVTSPGKLSEILKDSGFNLIHVRSAEDLPESVTDKTVLVVDLPATEQGAARAETLQRNGDVVREVFEVLKSKQSDVIGIFTGAKNSKLMLRESRRRITRNAAEARDEGNFENNYQNYTEFLMYLEKAPVLKLYTGDKKVWANFTLNYEATVRTNLTNVTASPPVITNVVELEYPNPIRVDEVGSTLNNAIIKLHFKAERGWWYLMDVLLDFDANINGTQYTNLKNVPLAVDDAIWTPYGSSYHCTPTLRLASNGFRNASVKADEAPEKISLEMNGFQMQPFKTEKQKFGDWYDCQGFFTEGIWAAIFIGLVLAMMLAWATSMVDDIKGPDRFDDPKGKTITVTATD